MLTISQRQVGSITIVDLNGKITISEGSAQFREAIRQLVEQEKPRLVLNFAGVTYVDSSGVGELVSTYTAISKQHGQLRLLHVPPRIKELLRITKLLSVFELFDDEAAALQSFR
ncbi:MAG: STAS domain-containing protein [Acidobacteriota bacterium]|nr:STAS domain-containing protein [Blastocatellia bacterium]MDW8240599.1 STAS domain-containing protein [Acidobacteriota bacterium]